MLYNPIPYIGVCDVEQNYKLYTKLLINKVSSLFKWEGLPDSIDPYFLELTLLLKGTICFTKFKDKLYALNGSQGGEPNVYYKPQFYIIANPILGSKEVRIRQADDSKSIEGLDGIIMGNSAVDLNGWEGGLSPLIYQTAGLLADNTSSFNISQINGRVSQVFVADNDQLARSAELILQNIYQGKPYKVVSQDILNKVNALPVASTGQNNTLLNLIEAHASILQNFYNEIGIGYQGNLKRERVNTAETQMMSGCYDINIWSMLKARQEAVEQINELFGTSISVDLNDEIFYPGSANATLGEDLSVQPEEGGEASTPDEVQEDKTALEEVEVKEENKEEKKDKEADEE